MALSERHLTTLKSDFNEDEIAPVIAELERITPAQTMDSEYNLENTIGALLSLADGDIGEVKVLVDAALIDFRDVIYWWALDNKKAKHPE